MSGLVSGLVSVPALVLALVPGSVPASDQRLLQDLLLLSAVLQVLHLLLLL